MRVTNGMMQNDSLYNLNESLKRVDDLQDELSSGLAVRRPSDDPARTSDIMHLQSAIDGNNQYRRNTEDGSNWLNTADGALGSLTDVLHRARQLGVEGANADLSDADRQALTLELQSLTQGALQISQTTYAGRYIFSGTQTGTAPVTLSGTTATYNGDTNAINREIGPGILESINVTGDRVFTSAAGIFPALFQLQTDMQANNQAAISADLQQMDTAIDRVVSVRSEVGARLNRLQAAVGWQDSAESNLTQLLSKTQDADIAKVIVSLTSAESTYRAALAVAAKVLPPTLTDFLR